MRWRASTLRSATRVVSRAICRRIVATSYYGIAYGAIGLTRARVWLKMWRQAMDRESGPLSHPRRMRIFCDGENLVARYQAIFSTPL